ncbi:MAG: MATE family efflux transporter [Treponema sp.]|nr:MATE family efflux transporter [Treponema sp.]MCL2237822.1 MATE family efflux transporter [Treponema sp.]
MSENSNLGVNPKKIFAIAIPIIIQQLSHQMQVWVDRAMLGHINPEFFSAVGNSLVPYFAVISTIVAISSGTTILIAQSVGAKNFELSRKYAECSFVGNSIFPVIAFLFFFFCSPWMFKLMGVQSPIYEYAVSYIRITSYSLFIIGIVSTCSSILQGIGFTKMIMVTGIITNVLNIFFDWVLIYGKFGLPAMNIEGAATATVIANFSALPFLIIYVIKRKKMPFKIKVRNIFKFDFNLYKNVFKIGVPSGGEYALWSLGNLFVVSYLNRIDIMAAGIYTLLFSIQGLSVILYAGFAQAGMTLAGQKTGENEPKQAINIVYKCLSFAIIVCAVVTAVYCAIPGKILGLFTSDALLIDFSTPFLLFLTITMFPKAANIVVGYGIRGTGDTRWMLYTQIFGTILVMTLCYILIFIAGLGLWAVFITSLADEAVRSIINMLRFSKGREFFLLKPFVKN